MNGSMNKIALITDSTCDIPPDLRQRHNIYVAPLYVLWGTEQFRDGVDITPEQFYARLARDPVHPATSQPTPQDFAALVQQAQAQGAEEAVIITISDRLSGTLDSARQAQGLVDIPLHTYDSRSTSMGLGWQVLAAARARDAGADAAGMIEAADRVRRKVAVIFTVDTLEYLHRGGRIGAAAKLLGTALQLKPQLILDAESGIVEPGARVRTRKKALESVYEAFFERVDASQPLHVTVLHIAARQEAEEIAERIQREHTVAEITLGDTSPVLGTHAGPGTVGIAGYSGE